MKKILIIAAYPKSLVNFRGELLKTLASMGNEVIAMASGATAQETKDIENLGVKYIDYPVKRNGLNPIQDFKTYLALKGIMKQEKPDIVFAYTIKPIIWGGLAANNLNNVNFHALVTGLGFAFQKEGFVKNILVKLVSSLYKKALKNSKSIIFQNSDNRDVFVKNNLIVTENIHLVNGSGVDLQRFSYVEADGRNIKFLLIARLLKDKGIAEYIEAAKIVKQQFPDADFELIGPEDPSPNGYSINELRKYDKLGIIKYLGSIDNVVPYIQNCHVYILPSYHEGLPKTVIESMAIGRPIITTHAPGCRDTVVDGKNGFLVPVKDSKILAEKMIWFIKNKEQINIMGKQSRIYAENKYDVHKVNSVILKILEL
ncbi:MAG: glycosyltransferase family 1 protein [Hyphomicrobiales bacterium]|nr:MAG: glycosyltransferase family 1 protein [Hyphomicrobiales bacterium]